MERIKVKQHPNSSVWKSLVIQQDNKEYGKYVPILVELYELLIVYCDSGRLWQFFTNVKFSGAPGVSTIKYYYPSSFMKNILNYEWKNKIPE